MIEITAKDKYNIQPRNVAIIFCENSVIGIPRNNRKNILHKDIKSIAAKQTTQLTTLKDASMVNKDQRGQQNGVL